LAAVTSAALRMMLTMQRPSRPDVRRLVQHCSAGCGPEQRIPGASDFNSSRGLSVLCVSLTDMSKRTEITIETHRRLIVRQFGGSVMGWCNGCLCEVLLLTPNEAAAVAGVSSRTMYQWLERDLVHFNENLGVLMICAESLTNEKGDRTCINSKNR